MENILADNISGLRCMDLYDTLHIEERSKGFGHVIFEELPHFSRRRRNNSKWNTTHTHKIRSGRDKKLVTGGPSILKSDQKHENKSWTVSGDFNLDPQWLLHKKIQDYGKEFTLLIVPKPLQKTCAVQKSY